MARSYDSELDVIAQRDSNPVPLLHTDILQATCQSVALQLERLVIQARLLVAGYDTN